MAILEVLVSAILAINLSYTAIELNYGEGYVDTRSKNTIIATEDHTSLIILTSNLEEEINKHIEMIIRDENKIGLSESISKVTRFEDFIQIANKNTGIEINLIKAVMLSESGGNLRVCSFAGACGPMQLMKTIGKYMGLRIGKFVDERMHPKSIISGAKYLKELFRWYDENLILGLISYNLGPTKTDKLILKFGSTWDNLKYHLPEETRNYVVKVLSRKYILDDIDKYGVKYNKLPLFSDQLKDSIEYNVNTGDNLYDISRKFGIGLNKLKNVNPEILDYWLIDVDQKIRIPIP